MKSNLISNLVGLLGLLCCISKYRVNCKTIVEMRFKEFENPGNKLLNNGCCDKIMPSLLGCYFYCEHFFEISIKPYPGYKPRVKYIKTYVLAEGKTYFTKEMQLNRRHKNPWIFTYDKPYVSFYFGIEYLRTFFVSLRQEEEEREEHWPSQRGNRPLEKIRRIIQRDDPLHQGSRNNYKV